MDVTKQNFQARFPFLLTAIANAHFTTIDVELSGIPGRRTHNKWKDLRGLSGLPTLQARYRDIKKAVETYQILQIGITCVGVDQINGTNN